MSFSRYMINLPDSLAYYTEGKKQALQMIGDNPKNRKFVNDLARIDPTSTNKYIDVIVRILKKNPSISRSKLVGDFRSLVPLIDAAEKKQVNIDLSRINDIDTLRKSLVSQRNTGGKKTPVRIPNTIKKDKDYLLLPMSTQERHFYIPLNYEASNIIASKKVANCEGKWCVAYDNNRSHWRSHVVRTRNIIVYLIDQSDGVSPAYRKMAFVFDKNGDIVSVYNAEDAKISGFDDKNFNYHEKLTQYIKSNASSIREKIEQTHQKQNPVMLYRETGKLPPEKEMNNYLNRVQFNGSSDLKQTVKNGKLFYTIFPEDFAYFISNYKDVDLDDYSGYADELDDDDIWEEMKMMLSGKSRSIIENKYPDLFDYDRYDDIDFENEPYDEDDIEELLQFARDAFDQAATELLQKRTIDMAMDEMERAYCLKHVENYVFEFLFERFAKEVNEDEYEEELESDFDITDVYKMIGEREPNARWWDFDIDPSRKQISDAFESIIEDFL